MVRKRSRVSLDVRALEGQKETSLRRVSRVSKKRRLWRTRPEFVDLRVPALLDAVHSVRRGGCEEGRGLTTTEFGAFVRARLGPNRQVLLFPHGRSSSA